MTFNILHSQEQEGEWIKSTPSTTIILCTLFGFRKTSLIILTSGKVADELVDLADWLFNCNMLFFFYRRQLISPDFYSCSSIDPV